MCCRGSAQGGGGGESHVTLLSNKLRATLTRIHENLIVDSSTSELIEQGQVSPGVVTDKVLRPRLSPVVNLHGLATFSAY